ncbi:MAG TPA: hypothetical protein VGJ84_21890 [Polyangiaceae bacterium]|jgi:hypothetical protein
MTRTPKKQAKHLGGRPKLEDSERLDVQIGVRTDAKTSRRLNALAARYGRLAPLSHVARAALEYGLDVIERDPTILFFKEEKDQAERFLMKHWGAAGTLGGAEKQHEEYVVYLDSGKATVTVEDSERFEARSDKSFRNALDALAEKFPPTHPLPWHVPISAQPKSRKRGRK